MEAEAKRKADEERKRKEVEAKIKLDKTEPAKIKPPKRPSAQKAITNSIGMKFVLIPAGKFVMGSPPEEPGRDKNEKQHEVIISKKFYLQITPVSQRHWEKVMWLNPSHFFTKGGNDLPVEGVSWSKAQKFISKLNNKEGTIKYRLPTEAEWEYACRAGTETTYSFGGEVDKIGEYAWYKNNSKSWTHPVGKKKPNAWGFYDMHGNVWEWCQDWYGNYPSNAVSDPKGPGNGQKRVLRGGSWGFSASNIRSAFRHGGNPENKTFIGFRVARDF
jgi:formylglycine-generating enzyme required for sulfatase activity